MKQIFFTLATAALLTSACTSRNRVGNEGNTGDGGVESTRVRYGDSAPSTEPGRTNPHDSAGQHRDSTGRPDTLPGSHR